MYYFKNLKISTVFKVSIWIFILLGVFFIVAQFAQDRGMWMDEVELVTNIINSNFSELFEPFDNGQVAPILYLVIQKILIEIFGSSDIVFRIFPLSATIASSYFLYKILRFFSIKKSISLMGVSLFLMHPHIVYFSSEVKQYPLDIFASLALILIYLKIQNLRKFNKKIGFTLLSIPLFFISHITIIIFIPVALLLVFKEIKELKKIQISTYIFLTICSISFVTYYLLFVSNHSNKELMLSYWIGRGLPNENITFMSYCIWSIKVVVKQLFLRLISFDCYQLMFLSLITFLLCVFYLVKKKREYILVLIISPIIIHLFLAVIGIYPFWRRLILYMLPLFILLIIITIGVFNSLNTKRGLLKSSISALFFVYLTFNLVYNLNKFPFQKDTLKLAITDLNKINYQDEPILVFAGKSGLFYYKDLTLSFYDKIENIGNTGAYPDLIESIKNRKMTSNHWLIFSYRSTEWKNKVLPILKKKGQIELIRSKKTFLGGENGYLYKFTPYTIEAL